MGKLTLRLVILFSSVILTEAAFTQSDSQMYKFFDKTDFKKSYLGVGISTNVFTGSEFDGFHDRYLLSQVTRGFVAEYQYFLDAHNYFAIRGKLQCRFVNYDGEYSEAEDGLFFIYDKWFFNIEIPVMFKHDFYIEDMYLATGVIGCGIDFTTADNKLMYSGRYVANDGYWLPKEQDEYDKVYLCLPDKPRFFLTAGLAFRHFFTQSCKVEFNFLYNLYCGGTYDIYTEHYKNNINQSMNLSGSFYGNYFSVGTTVFF